MGSPRPRVPLSTCTVRALSLLLGTKSGFHLRPIVEVVICFTHLNFLLLGEGQLRVTTEWSNSKLQGQVTLKASVVEEGTHPLAGQPTGSGFVLWGAIPILRFPSGGVAGDVLIYKCYFLPKLHTDVS